MPQKTKQILLSVLPVTIIATFLVVVVIYAWTEPTQSPPFGNVPAPINVSSSTQTFLDSKILKVRENGTGILQLNGGLNVRGVGVFMGNLSIGTTTPPLEKLDIAGDLRLSNFRTRTMTRTLPLKVNEAVDIGKFTFTNGGGTLWISVTVPSNGYSVAKQYLLPIQYNQQSDTWTTALPISDSGEYRGNDFALDVRVKDNVAELRLRTTANNISNPGRAYIVIKQEGVNTDRFDPSFLTTKVTNVPTTTTEGTVITQVNGKVGIGRTNPEAELDVEGFVKGRSGLCIGNECRDSWPSEGGFKDYYIVESDGQIKEGTMLCCRNAGDILIEGHWSSYVGDKNAWYKRIGNNCMEFYEGQGRGQVGFAEIFCGTSISGFSKSLEEKERQKSEIERIYNEALADGDIEKCEQITQEEIRDYCKKVILEMSFERP